MYNNLLIVFLKNLFKMPKLIELTKSIETNKIRF